MIRTVSRFAALAALLTACGPADDPAGDGPADGDADDAAAATDEGSTGDPAEADVTYFRDIKPIIDARCGTCHVEGGVSPFPLETLDDAKAYAVAAPSVIHAGTMPPWKPTSECNEYVAERKIPDDEVALLDAWIEAGMPDGDPADEPPPLEVERQELSRVDLRLDMPEAYTPTKSPDDYRCFVLDWPEEYTDTTYVTGMRVDPGNQSIVHHVIVYVAPADARDEYQALDDADPGPGFTCFGGTGGTIVGSVGGWTPGSLGADTPAGIGHPIEPGSMLVLQMHYNTLTTDPAPDASALELKIDDTVEHEAFMIPVVNPKWLSDGGMMIPAGDPDVVHETALDPRLFAPDVEQLTIHTALHHMHLLGTTGRMTIQHEDGTEDCILAIDDWDFEWQDFYQLREPLQWKAGDRFGIECHYDNTAENQPLVDGKLLEPRDVQWGEGTTDEMCIGFMMATAD